MEEFVHRNLTFMLISFSLFLLVYPIHFVSIAFAQEKMLGNGWTSGTPLPTPRTEVTSANLDDDALMRVISGNAPRIILKYGA